VREVTVLVVKINKTVCTEYAITTSNDDDDDDDE
jgi:hypothetical protein